MHDTSSLKQLIQQLMPRQPEIIMGKVFCDNPVKIQALNDEKLILTSKNLTIPSRLSDLKTGEYIHILVWNCGKKYYVLDRR